MSKKDTIKTIVKHFVDGVGYGYTICNCGCIYYDTQIINNRVKYSYDKCISCHCILKFAIEQIEYDIEQDIIYDNMIDQMTKGIALMVEEILPFDYNAIYAQFLKIEEKYNISRYIELKYTNDLY